jgi:ribosomal protein S27E
MNRQSLAARRAEREEILRKFASEEEHFEASGSVKHSNEMNQYPGEMKYPTMKLEGENSMKGENPDFAKTKVPTKNPKNLQLKDSMDAVGFEGSEGTSSDFEYEVDWDQMDGVVPTTGEAKLKGFEIPSEMDLQARKTTVAYKDMHSEENHSSEKKEAYKCSQCGNSRSMTAREAEMAECENCAKTVKAQEAPKGDLGIAVKNVEDNAGLTAVEKGLDAINKTTVSSVDTARIKAAYSCATKLALAGIINSNETDDYAGQLLEDGLRADVMIKNTQLLLRSAQASAERVAAASAERLNVRTASTMGISTSPALSGSSNSAALDIQSALRGLWTTPQIGD